jgi:uncharacterized sulfatase
MTRILATLASLVLCTLLCGQALAAERPNILWLTSEDHGPEMGCYGDQLARTPNVDALAAKGMLFKRAWSTAPVCAPARTAIISGVYPSSSGGLHMRSMVSLPEGMKLYPQYLREAGYYCTNNSKTDYNVRAPRTLWDESSGKATWKNRGEGQPFFAIFNSTKSHESQIRTRPHTQITRPADVRVPAYHPDTPEVREDWAQYYDKVSEADADAGRHLQELAAAGLADETIVFYYGDYYPLTPWTRDNKAWMAWQFDRPETGDGLVQAFRRPEAEADSIRLKLGGLDPAAQYKLTSIDGNDPVAMGGRELMANGFSVTIHERPGVAIFVYQRVQP